MELKDSIDQLTEKIIQLKDSILTEEATKKCIYYAIHQCIRV
jgi:hypothetical protein